MKRLLVLVVLVGIAVSANVQAQCGPPLPTPRVAFLNKVNEPGFVRYWFTVTNRAAFNNVFFTPSPNLPPCGANPNAARTWMRIFNGTTNAYIYGYCALPNNAAMAKLWFAVPTASPQPKSFYITLEDRLCHVTKTSNKAAIP
jgi:hypothetical protein